LGILTDDRLLHPWNIHSAIVLILPEKVTDFKFVHP
jgi:hypothetical protein